MPTFIIVSSDLAFGWSAEEIAHRAGGGAGANPSFGEHPGLEGNERFESLYWVAKLHDGRFNAVRLFCKGVEVNLARSARIRTGGMELVLA